MTIRLLSAAILAALCLPPALHAAEPQPASSPSPADPSHPDDSVELDRVLVFGSKPIVLPSNQTERQGESLDPARAASSDTAALLHGVPGISLQGAGGVSSMPAIHGLGGDRNRILVDGVESIASCPNHMNPPLSYIDPSRVDSIQVYAGITPVSAGGDSIGGSIVVQPVAPWFADSGEGWNLQGTLAAFYRSNGDARGGNLSATLADDRLSLRYDGAIARAGNYRTAEPFHTTTATGREGHALPLNEVASTAYQTRNHALNVAWRSDQHLLQASVSRQEIPYQLYPNQRMDMLENTQNRARLSWLGRFDWGNVQAQAWREDVRHVMDFGADKQFWYGMQAAVPGNPVDTRACAPIGPMCASGMPMHTESSTNGATLTATLTPDDATLWRFGAETLRYRLDDWWPPSGGMMWPGTFWNIRDGRRDRTSAFVEWESRWNPQWMSLLGTRVTHLVTDAGPVRGYDIDPAPPGSYMATHAEATAFNARDRRRSDTVVDVTALLRYSPAERFAAELGYAHKVRMPNLYERYAWSSWTMAAAMINTAGDGNGYVGNIDLKPERAHTLSATARWQGEDDRWHVTVTPYITHIEDYIDAVPVTNVQPGAFNVLRHANQSARLHGVDLSARIPLADTAAGAFGLDGTVNYTRGTNRTTGDDLYNIMPLNARIGLNHRLGNWTGSLEWEAARAKRDVSDVRNEIPTHGYGLLHLRGRYAWEHVQLDAGVENLLDQAYRLPLGGAYTAQGRTMAINGIPWGIAVPGPGRSFYLRMQYAF